MKQTKYRHSRRQVLLCKSGELHTYGEFLCDAMENIQVFSVLIKSDLIILVLLQIRR